MSAKTSSPDSPAFRDEMHSQHLRLRLLLRATDEVLSARSGQRESRLLCSALVVLLTDLSKELPEHFEFGVGIVLGARVRALRGALGQPLGPIEETPS